MKHEVLTARWWAAAGIRALRTLAQAAIAAIGTAAMINEVNWIVVASTAVLSGILSLLTSLAGLPELEDLGYSGKHEGE